MAYFVPTRSVPFGAISVHRVVAALYALPEAVDAWLKARETDKVLRQLTDRELDDIGLTRGMIEDAAHSMSAR